MDTRVSLIREIADRVASLEEERDELKKDIDAEIAAAKDKGHDPVELRAAIANRRKRNKDPNKYDQKETTRVQYELALGMHPELLTELSHEHMRPTTPRPIPTAVDDSFDKPAAH